MVMGFLRRRVVSSSLNGRQGFSCCSVSPELAPSADRILDSKRKIPPAAEYSVTFHLEPLTGSKFLFWVIFSSSRYQWIRRWQAKIFAARLPPVYRRSSSLSGTV